MRSCGLLARQGTRRGAGEVGAGVGGGGGVVGGCGSKLNEFTAKLRDAPLNRYASRIARKSVGVAARQRRLYGDGRDERAREAHERYVAKTVGDPR